MRRIDITPGIAGAASLDWIDGRMLPYVAALRG